MKLLIGELMELWQESFSYELILWAIWKLHQYWFFRNFKKIRWYNVFIFLLVVFYSAYAHNFWWHYLWKVTGNLPYQTFNGLASFHYWSLTIYLQLYTNLREFAFRLYLFGILEDQCGVIFVTLRCTSVVIELFL